MSRRYLASSEAHEKEMKEKLVKLQAGDTEDSEDLLGHMSIDT